jgi:AraC family transcriptional regulator, regulatory protein of adaptative response / methylated-DNA-[protein]-cysteine methyltransferase
MADFSTEHDASRQPFLNSKASAGVWRWPALAMLVTYY